MKNKDLVIKAEHIESVMDHKKQLRDIAKTNILKHQELSCTQYNKNRKSPTIYNIGDLDAIQRTQFGFGLKLQLKFFGPYKVIAVQSNDRYQVIEVQSNDRYQVQKVGQHAAPNLTSTVSDYMKGLTEL